MKNRSPRLLARQLLSTFSTLVLVVVAVGLAWAMQIAGAGGRF
jgi:hypothetical protein